MLSMMLECTLHTHLYMYISAHSHHVFASDVFLFLAFNLFQMNCDFIFNQCFHQLSPQSSQMKQE